MPIDLDDPIALMLVAAAALERSGAECAAYGGLALGMYGEPRETRDADFAVTSVDIERARLALADLGVDVVTAFSNVRFGGCDVISAIARRRQPGCFSSIENAVSS